MKKLSLLSSLVLSGFLTACASYSPQPLLPEKSLAQLDARNLADPVWMQQLQAQFTQYQWPPQRWSLDQLVLVAEQIHPDIAAANAEYQQAQHSFRDSSLLANPTFNAAVQHTNTPADGQSVWSPSIGLDVLIETAGKRDARKRIAAQQVAIARHHLADVSWQLRSHIRDALLDLSEAQATQYDLQQQQQVLRAGLAAWQQRVAAGVSSRPEQLTAQSQLMALQQQLVAAQQHALDARQQLATALGLSPTATAQLNLDLPASVESSLAAPLSQAVVMQRVQARADVQSALADYAVSEAQLQQEVANQYPNITLSPGLVWDASAISWSLASNLVLPLFHHNQPAIHAAEAARQASYHHAESLLLTRRNAIEQAEQDEQFTLKTVQQAQATNQLADQALQRMTHSFKAGAADRLQYLDAENTQLTAHLNFVQSQLAHARAVAALEDALQQPLSHFF